MTSAPAPAPAPRLTGAEERQEAFGARFAEVAEPAFQERLDAQGYGIIPALLSPADCAALIELYAQPERFRSRIVMERHGFGRGEYQYFSYPLPEIVAALRRAAYPSLAATANRWHRRLNLAPCFPDDLDRFLAQCHAAGQTRPTPLMLKYGPEDYNRLHRDLYGEVHFPLQLAVLLSVPGPGGGWGGEGDFEGGEFVLTEQRPRSQSRAEVVPLGQGDAVVFAVNQRPARGARGFYRLAMRHGVSQVRAGLRYCLGVIFHDAA